MKNKLFIPVQLLIVLNPISCKILNYFLSLQDMKVIFLYADSLSKLLRIEKENVEFGIETLFVNKIINIYRIEGSNYCIKFNPQLFDYFKSIPLKEISKCDTYWDLIKEKTFYQKAKLIKLN